MSNNLLSISDLTKKETLDLIEFASNFKNEAGSFRKADLFPDKTVANIFCEPSTRTKSSFEIAPRNLGRSVIDFDAPSSQTGCPSEASNHPRSSVDSSGAPILEPRNLSDSTREKHF